MSTSGTIISIRAHQPPTPGSPPDWRTQLGQIVVEIATDTGLQGIGVGGGGRAGIHIVETVLRDVLLGQDASDVEGLHAAMLSHTVFFGRKGVVVMALSGVDLALWDLRGKAAGKSVAELLNPAVDHARPLRSYVTVFDDVQAEAALRSGAAAIKLHVERFGARPDAAAVGDLVRRVRDRLGSAATIMLDAFGRWDEQTTLRVADRIASYGITWLEEPLPPDDRDGYERLANRCPVPIAGGEHEYLVEGFGELIDRRLHAVLQPDVNWCGGLTTLVAVYRLAAAAGVRVCPHRGSEPFSMPALAALDPNPLAESPRTWFCCLSGGPEITDGCICPSPAPGFGIRLRR